MSARIAVGSVPPWLPALLLMVSSGVPLVSMAQQSVSVPVEIEHNSNPALTTGEAIGVTRYRVSPQYTLVRQNGPTQTRFSFGGVIERSSDTAVSDHRSDPNVSAAIERDLPLGSIGFRAALSESSTREEEFADTGVVSSDATQRNTALDGTWTHELSDVSRFTLGLGAAEVRYDTSSLVGYREIRTSVGLTHDLKEDTQVTARWEGSRLDPELDTASSSQSLLAVGLSSRLSEALRLAAEIGTVRTFGLVSARTPSSRLRLDYAGERLASSLEWSRSTAALGSLGGYASTRLLGWTAEYSLTERTAVNLLASQARSQGVGGAEGTSLLFGLRHSVSEFWALEGRLGQLRSRPNAGGSATANVVGLLLTYSHPNF